MILDEEKQRHVVWLWRKREGGSQQHVVSAAFRSGARRTDEP